MFVSDVFENITGRKCVYNITAIKNIPSIIDNGILCYNAAKRFLHSSIAIDTVQDRRERVIIPNGLCLHRYANLYFDYRNPMLYKRKDIAEQICILAVDVSIMNHPDCIFSDRNAATDLVKFYPAAEGVNEIDFKTVFAKYWTHDNHYEYLNHKAIKCAELLIPHCVPYDYIVKACVVNNSAKEALLNAGFDKQIVVSSEVFFQ